MKRNFLAYHTTTFSSVYIFKRACNGCFDEKLYSCRTFSFNTWQLFRFFLKNDFCAKSKCADPNKMLTIETN